MAGEHNGINVCATINTTGPHGSGIAYFWLEVDGGLPKLTNHTPLAALLGLSKEQLQRTAKQLFVAWMGDYGNAALKGRTNVDLVIDVEDILLLRESGDVKMIPLLSAYRVVGGKLRLYLHGWFLPAAGLSGEPLLLGDVDLVDFPTLHDALAEMPPSSWEQIAKSVFNKWTGVKPEILIALQRLGSIHHTVDVRALHSYCREQRLLPLGHRSPPPPGG